MVKKSKVSEKNKRRNETTRTVRINKDTVEAVADNCKETGVPIGRFFALAAKERLEKK